MTAAEEREVARRYAGGATIAELALGVGTHRAKVAGAVRRAGGVVRRPGRPPADVDQRLAARLHRQFRGGRLTLRAFAARLDVSVPTAVRLARRLDGAP